MTKSSQRRDRFRYQRLDSERDYCGQVIVDLGRDPLDELSMAFFDQEYVEVSWYPFTPEDFERKEVKRILAQQLQDGTDDYVQIDVADLRRRQLRKGKAAAVTMAADRWTTMTTPEPLSTCAVA